MPDPQETIEALRDHVRAAAVGTTAVAESLSYAQGDLRRRHRLAQWRSELEYMDERLAAWAKAVARA